MNGKASHSSHPHCFIVLSRSLQAEITGASFCRSHMASASHIQGDFGKVISRGCAQGSQSVKDSDSVTVFLVPLWGQGYLVLTYCCREEAAAPHPTQAHCPLGRQEVRHRAKKQGCQCPHFLLHPSRGGGLASGVSAPASMMLHSPCQMDREFNAIPGEEVDVSGWGWPLRVIACPAFELVFLLLHPRCEIPHHQRPPSHSAPPPWQTETRG